jgi:hypothetical protein
MRRLVLAFLAIAPSAAFAYIAENRHSVAPVSGAVFEVVGEPGSGAQQYWCAAGEYARDRLGARSNARVYIVRGRGPAQSEPGATAVRFTIDPGAAGVTPISPRLSLSVDAIGDNLPVASAVTYCYNVVSKP